MNKGRFENNLHGPLPNKVAAMRPANPNSDRTVFIPPPNKRRKTLKTPPPINPGPLSLSKRSSVERHIDLTKDEVGLGPHSSTASGDSDDSLNLLPPSSRIANDGHATRRLKAGRGESSKAADSDAEAEAIEEYPEETKKRMTPKDRGGKVQGIVQNIESRNGGEVRRPKLHLNSDNPLVLFPPSKHKTKVRLFFMKWEDSWLTPDPKAGPINNSLSQPTIFTHGLKGKGKDVHALAITDWVRGTEHLVTSREHFLSFRAEGGKPILCVTSASGLQELKITINGVNNEIRDLQVSPHTLRALRSVYTLPMVTRPRML